MVKDTQKVLQAPTMKLSRGCTSCSSWSSFTSLWRRWRTKSIITSSSIVWFAAAMARDKAKLWPSCWGGDSRMQCRHAARIAANRRTRHHQDQKFTPQKHFWGDDCVCILTRTHSVIFIGLYSSIRLPKDIHLHIWASISIHVQLTVFRLHHYTFWKPSLPLDDRPFHLPHQMNETCYKN